MLLFERYSDRCTLQTEIKLDKNNSYGLSVKREPLFKGKK